MQHYKSGLFLIIYVLFLFILPSFMLSVSHCIQSIAYRNFLVYAIILSFGFCLFWSDLITELKIIGSKKKYLKNIVLWTIGAFILLNILGLFIPTEGISQNEESIRKITEAHPILMLFPVVILGPIVEELVFRYILIGKFPRYKWLGVLTSSLLFGILHLTSGEFMFLYIYGTMGLILGGIYYKSKNIWFPIGVHILNNLIVTLITLFL